MISNVHSHSHWCRHGRGNLEDYVKEGLRCGLQSMAVCEHVASEMPMGPRMPWSDMPAYLAEADEVIERYGKQIELFKAFECEYFPEALERFVQLRDHHDVPLWILGQHESADHRYDYFAMQDRDAETRQYTADVIVALNTGFFQLLAHPDVILVNYDRPTPLVMECMDRIFAECEKLKVAVEINANGLRRPTGYPNREIWMLSKKYKLTTIISSDAHDPRCLVDDAVHQAEQMAAEWGIEITPALKLK